MKENVERTFALEAAYLEKIKANAKYASIDKIDLTISNAFAPEYSDADLLSSISARTIECRDAIERRESQNQTVYTILSVIRADVIYRVSSSPKAGGGVGLPPEVLEGLRVELDGSVISTQDQTIAGEGLHWGIKPDVFKLVPSFGAVSGPPIIDGLRRLSARERVSLVAEPVILISEKADADSP